MRDLSDIELRSLEILSSSCTDFVLVHATATGLAKSTFDATREVRDFLIRTQTHDYDSQNRGPEHKYSLPIVVAEPDGQTKLRSISFNRPRSGNGDPRFWISRFGDSCPPDAVFVLAVRGKQLSVEVLDQEWSIPPRISITHELSGGQMAQSDPDSVINGEWWTDIGRLWDRATGGPDVAAKPDSGPEFWDTSPRPAGVDAATAWFAARMNSPIPTLLFLVGGPGAGKSHTAAALVDALEMVSIPDEGLANRSYDYKSLDGASVRLVNDATIPDLNIPRDALRADIDHTMKLSGSLIACVNRGVLIEEKAGAAWDPQTRSSFSRLLIHWLADGDLESGDSDLRIELSKANTDFLRGCRVLDAGTVVAEVVAVSVDVCSLLELSPTATFVDSKEGVHSFKTSDYSVTDFTKRDSMNAELIPAIDLVRRVTSKLSPPAMNPVLLNPIEANLKSLDNPTVRQGLVSALRASEVVAGQRMTYRELWGATVRSIVGNIPEQIGRDFLEEHVSKLQPTSSDPATRFLQIMELADLRFSQSIFAREDAGPGSYDPVLHLTSAVDPVLDARPGTFENNNWASGWASPITDAFDTPINDASPLEGLLGTLLRAEDPFRSAITPFDESVDEAYALAMRHVGDDTTRFNFAARYGAYLTRLYAVANGITAFRQEISLWTRTRVMSPNLPDQLAAPMRTLLRPKRKPESPDSTSVIPVFDSRTDPIIGRSAQPRFGLRTGDIQMTTRTFSDEVIMTLSESGVEVASVALDFVLVREALACDAQRPGITELTETASPRLERFRSARLVSSLLANANLCAVVDDREVQISVSSS